MAGNPYLSAALLDPSIASNQAALERNMAIAQMLRQQGMSPIDAPSNGGIASAASPLQGLAKMLQLYGANQYDANNDQARANLTQQTAQVMRGVASNMGGGDYQLSPGLIDAGNAGIPGAEDIIKATVADQSRAQMTDVEKLLSALKTAPQGSPREDALLQALSKATYLAPVDAKPGTPILDPRTNRVIAYAPKAADGVNVNFGTDANGVTSPTSANAIPGYARANAQITGDQAGAEASAKAPYQLVQSYDPTTQQPTTGYAGSLLSAPGAPKLGYSLQNGSPAGRPATVPTGPATGAPDQIKAMQSRWAALSDEASNAPATINNLQQIKDFATTARTGKTSDQLRMMDSVLALAGSKSAADRAVANDLLGKNAAQITARLGQGGTDAARETLKAAYPNASMMAAAIAEASDNLMAVQHKQQAKAAFLQQQAAGNNATQYQQSEMAFDRAADPRIFQWKAMPPGPEKDAYKARILKQDPTLMQKAQALQAMGVQ